MFQIAHTYELENKMKKSTKILGYSIPVIPLLAFSMIAVVAIAIVLPYWQGSLDRNITVHGLTAMILDPELFENYENQVELSTFHTSFEDIRSDSCIIAVTDSEMPTDDLYLKITISAVESLPSGLIISAKVVYTEFCLIGNTEQTPYIAVWDSSGTVTSNIFSPSGWKTRAIIESVLTPDTVPINMESGEAFWTIPEANQPLITFDLPLDYGPGSSVGDLTVVGCNGLLVYFEVDDSDCDSMIGESFGTVAISFDFEIGRLIA